MTRYKYIGLFILLIFIFTIFLTINTSADTYEVSIPASYDGYIHRNIGPAIYTRYDDVIYNIVRHAGPLFGYWQERAFIEWNISAIPASANIVDIGITIQGAGSTQTHPNCERTYIYNLSVGVIPSLEIDNTPGNKNIFDGEHTNLAWYRGACTGGCSVLPCPFPSNTINTFNTTMGGDYWFNNFIVQAGNVNSKAVDSVQDALTSGYYSILMWQTYNAALTGTYSWYYSDDSVELTPLLWVKYEITVPTTNYSYPADFETGVGWDATGVNLSFNISHDYGDLMNMTWWAYNETSSTFVQIGSNLSVPAGNYNQTWYNNNYTVFTDGFEPCTTYYWKVEVNDSNGNLSIFYREFTTYCIEPPTNFNSYSLDNSTLNLTWVKMPDHTGSTNTTIYYSIGADPPTWGNGVFLCNTSEEYFEASLSEATCYAFSAWSIHQTASGDWYRSINRAIRTDCTEGGNFSIMFRDEDTHVPLDFTAYPYNETIFNLRVHYDDDYDEFEISETFMGSSSEYFVNASQDILYLELFIHYDFFNDNIPRGRCGYAQYVRKLLPSAAVEKTFTFYVANYTVYGEYFYCMNTTGTLEQYLDSSYQDSVVNYIYSFHDKTHIYDSAVENDAYLEIFSFNDSVRFIVHQELWDSAEKVYPHLIFERGYLCKVGLISDPTQFTYIGLAPVHEVIQETLSIQVIDENITYLFGDIITYSIGWDGNKINVVYIDTLLQTISLTCTVYDIDGVQVYTSTVNGFSDYTFVTGVLDNTKVYEIDLIISHPTFIELYGSSIIIVDKIPLLPGVTAITDVSIYNNLLTPIIGAPPIHNPTTGEQVGWFEMGAFLFVLSIFGLLIKHPPIAFMASGITMVGISGLISGFTVAIGTVGVIMAILGFWYFLATRGSRR